jgi:predicted P-loop ATPase
VIEIPKRHEIPVQWVLENRENIWAAALDGYQKGLSNQIPREFADEMAEELGNFMHEDVLVEPIKKFLQRYSGQGEESANFPLEDVAKHLQFELSHFSRADQNRVTAILRQEGWTTKSVWVEEIKKTARRWVRA